MNIFCWIFIFIYNASETLMLKDKPILINKLRNESVQKYSNYSVDCNLKYELLKISKINVYINDKLMNSTEIITIMNDTKIECSVTFENNVSLRHTAFITAVNTYNETTKYQFYRSNCIQSIDDNTICESYFKSSPYNTRYLLNNQTRKLTEEFMQGLYKRLNNNHIYLNHETDGCVDRLIGLMCGFIYPNCDTDKKLICRETCDLILNLLCRKVLKHLMKEIEFFSELYYMSIYKFTEYARYKYETEFMLQSLSYLKMINNCDQLSKRGLLSSRSNGNCFYMDLEVLDMNQAKETFKESCYNNRGSLYNYSAGEEKCMNWLDVPSQFIQSFPSYQFTKLKNNCRNPGNVFNKPSCIIPSSGFHKSYSFVTQLKNLNIYPCKSAILCDSNQTNHKSKMAIYIKHYEVAIYVIFLSLVSLLVIGNFIQYVRRKKRKSRSLSHDVSQTIRDNIPFKFSLTLPSNFSSFRNTSENNVSFYYQTGYNDIGYFEFDFCPIYNKNYLKCIKELGKSKFGKLELIKIDFEHEHTANKCAVLEEDETFCNSKKLIISGDVEFHNQPCWPFDLSLNSGHSQYAVIEYCQKLSNNEIKIFWNQTKLLAGFKNENIIRFYGIIFDSCGNINARLIEYLPNGNLKLMFQLKNYKLVQSSQFKDSNVTKNIVNEETDIFPNRDFDKIIEIAESGKITSCQRIVEIDNARLIKWALQISDAISYLHRNRIIHRDVKTENCWLDENFNVKLTDCSHAVALKGSNTHFTKFVIESEQEDLPLKWLPKETLETKLFSTKTDVHMFGVFLWELMSHGSEPFDNMNDHEVFIAIINNQKLPIPPDCPQNISNLINLCCSPEQIRPTIDTINDMLRKYSFSI